MTRRTWLGALVAASAVLFGCGPSMRHLVESDMRFEHCYRIDDDPTTSLADKRSCWSEWTRSYAKGQDRSRVHYARDRMRVLDGAIATAPPVATTAVACPPPANPYAPPPSIAPKSDETAAANSSSTSPKTTVASCSDACTKTWRGCATPCGAESGCVLDCDARFRACIKGCL